MLMFSREDEQLRVHCVREHRMRRNSSLKGKALRAWHREEHTDGSNHMHEDGFWEECDNYRDPETPKVNDDLEEEK